MASATVSELPRNKTHLSLDEIDHLAALLTKSEGLSDLLASAGESCKELDPKTVASTAWTLHDMLTEVRRVLGV